MIFCNFGILTSFVFGNFFNYTFIPYLLAIFPTLFLCVFVFLPESPSQLLRMGREDEAFRSLIFFRGENTGKTSEEIWTEFERLKEDVDPKCVKKEEQGKVTWADFSEYFVRNILFL